MAYLDATERAGESSLASPVTDHDAPPRRSGPFFSSVPVSHYRENIDKTGQQPRQVLSPAAGEEGRPPPASTATPCQIPGR